MGDNKANVEDMKKGKGTKGQKGQEEEDKKQAESEGSMEWRMSCRSSRS